MTEERKLGKVEAITDGTCLNISHSRFPSMHCCLHTAPSRHIGDLDPGARPEDHLLRHPGCRFDSWDYNGTYASSVNNWGTIAGTYQDANSVYHGFLRSPEGGFITFEAPGA